jgi:uncharacterized SAM-binding protein YcdF (DUF218 family)
MPSFGKRRSRPGCLAFLIAALLLALTVFLLRAPLLTAAGQVLVEDDGPQKADLIIVLGGDDFGTRIVKAAQLQQAGYAPSVLVSGPPHLLGPESDETIEYARRQGYSRSLFQPLPSKADSTRTETALIGQYLREHGVRKIILVTSNYHTRRAAKLMRKQNPGVWTVVVPAPDPSFTPSAWWKRRDGRKTFLFEWMKTVATVLGI